MNRESTQKNTDDEYYENLKVHQDKYLKGTDTHKDSLSFPIGFKVAVQHEDGQSYIIRIMKRGRLIMCNRKHIYRTLIIMEEYL